MPIKCTRSTKWVVKCFDLEEENSKLKSVIEDQNTAITILKEDNDLLEKQNHRLADKLLLLKKAINAMMGW